MEIREFTFSQTTYGILYSATNYRYGNYDNTAMNAVATALLLHHGIKFEDVTNYFSRIPIVYGQFDNGTLDGLSASDLGTSLKEISRDEEGNEWLTYLATKENHVRAFAEDDERIYIYCNKAQEVKIRMMSVMTAFFPDVFTEIDEWELALMESISKSDSELFYKMMREFESVIAEKAKIVLLDNYEGFSFKYKIQQMWGRVEQCINDIKRYTNSLSTAIKNKNELIAEINVMKKCKDDTADIVKNYFMADNNITITSSSKDQIDFDVLSYYEATEVDEERFLDEYEYKDSYLWRYSDSHSWIINVLKEIVINKKGKLRMFAHFTINSTQGVFVNGNCTSPEYGYAPNPHLWIYNCTGGNESAIVEANSRMDYLTALDICVSCVPSVNWEEDVSAERLVDWLVSNRHVPVIEIEDGKVISFEEAKKEWGIN